mgnify:CR=1 FL=1
MKKKLIAGNWKRNLTLNASIELTGNIVKNVPKKSIIETEVLICPTFIALSACSTLLKDSGIMLGSQNMSDKMTELIQERSLLLCLRPLAVNSL